MATEVRCVGPEALEEIYPLVERFPTPRMTRADWRWLLFEYPWARGAARAWLLRVDGAAVGFIGAVFSARTLGGRPEKFCNPTSLVVLEEHRFAALLLLRPILAMADHTLLVLTPSPAAHAMFTRLKLRPLEETQLVLPPLPAPAQAARAARGSFTLEPDEIRAGLRGDEAAAFEDHAACPAARHVLLRRDGRTCWLVATVGRRRRIPYADVQHVGDPEFFWEHRLLAQAALIRAMGLPGLAMAIDARHLGGRRPPPALRWKARRLFRPAHQGITPGLLDGLYSEYMGLHL